MRWGSNDMDWRRDLMLWHPRLFLTTAEEPSRSFGYPHCERGWQDILVRLCRRIEVALRDGETFEFVRIKQKMGILLVDWDTEASKSTESAIGHAVDLAVARSACTCEICGAEGRLHANKGWLETAAQSTRPAIQCRPTWGRASTTSAGCAAGEARPAFTTRLRPRRRHFDRGAAALAAAGALRWPDFAVAPRTSKASSPSRAGECAVRHLNGYRGILQVDGYAAYNKLARSDRGDDGITLAGCWSHSRRKFYELHVAGSSEVATATLERMAKLWQVEKTVRGQSPDARVAARQQASAAVVADLFDLWQQTLRRISGKSNWPRRSAMLSRAVPSSNASCSTAASSSTPTSSSAPSDRRQLQERIACSRAATAADEPGRPSQHCCRLRISRIVSIDFARS
ncbi:hypothetical protein ABIF64_002805 [Bradyrhizobium japonicum]